MTRSNISHGDQFKISIKPLYQSQKNFSFNNKLFPFDFELFKSNSSFFFKYKNQYEYVECINLFNDEEIECFKNITDEAIHDFICLCQNEKCQINGSDIFYIQYLAYKFEVTELTKSLTDIASNNLINLDCKSFIFQNLYKNEGTNAFPTLSGEFTDIIARNLMNFIIDDKIFDFPICILYQILYKYYTQFNNQSMIKQGEPNENKKDNDNKIIEFLFKCLKKYQKDASILFSLVNFKNANYQTIIKKLLSDYQKTFDFGLIGNIIQRYALDVEHNNAKYKKIFVLLDMPISFEVNKKQDDNSDKINNQKINISQFEPNFQNENSNLFLEFSNLILIESL